MAKLPGSGERPEAGKQPSAFEQLLEAKIQLRRSAVEAKLQAALGKQPDSPLFVPLALDKPVRAQQTEDADHAVRGSPGSDDDGQHLAADPETNEPIVDESHQEYSLADSATSTANAGQCVCEISTSCPIAIASGKSDCRPSFAPASNRIREKKDAQGIL
jgi:hypothetical protein